MHLKLVGLVIMITSVILIGAACEPATNMDTTAPENSDSPVSIDSEPRQEEDQQQPTIDRDAVILELRQVFADKYSNPLDITSVQIEDMEENTYVRGEVGFADPTMPGRVEGALFFAARDAVTEEWQIVHDGNGIIPCEPLEQYDFPQRMMQDCVVQ